MSLLPSIRTPVEQIFRQIIKNALLNSENPILTPSPPEPKIGIKRVLPPYLGEMGYEIKFHLARVEPWLANGWKILARRPEFYPPGTAIHHPEFFAACNKILETHSIAAAGGGIYAPVPTNQSANLQLVPTLDGQAMAINLTLDNIAKIHREALAEIQLRQLCQEFLDYEGRPLTDYDRNITAFSETCLALSEIRRAEALRPTYLPPAFQNPPEPTPPHIGVQIRAVRHLIAHDRNSNQDFMLATAQKISAHLNLPIIAYGHPEGCIIPDDLPTTWRGTPESHLSRELGFLKSCRLMLAPDSGWTDLMAWLGIPVLLELLNFPYAFEDLRDSFHPSIALIDRTIPLEPQIDALLSAKHCLPNIDPRKGGLYKAKFPWDY